MNVKSASDSIVQDVYEYEDKIMTFREFLEETVKITVHRYQTSKDWNERFKIFGMFNASVKEYLADELGEEWLEVKRGDYWCGSSGFTDTIDDIIAAHINSGDSNVIDIIKKSLTSRNNTVIVTVELIRAIIKSQNAELRHLLGDFSIAAKLQEGVHLNT